MCVHVQVAYDMGTQTGGGPEQSRAAREEGCNSTKKLPTPHLEKSPTGAQAMAVPSVCLRESRSPLLGVEKSWHMEVGFHFPAALSLDADCCALPPKTRPRCSVPSPNLLTSYVGFV